MLTRLSIFVPAPPRPPPAPARAEEFCDKYPHTLVPTPGYWIECSRAISSGGDQGGGSALTIAGDTGAIGAGNGTVASSSSDALLEDEGVSTNTNVSPEESLRGMAEAEAEADAEADADAATTAESGVASTADPDEKDSLLSTPR